MEDGFVMVEDKEDDEQATTEQPLPAKAAASGVESLKADDETQDEEPEEESAGGLKGARTEPGQDLPAGVVAGKVDDTSFV